MLTDKTLSAKDFDAVEVLPASFGDDVVSYAKLQDVAWFEKPDPKKHTKRKARRASARLQYDKAMLAYNADANAYALLPVAQQKKTTAPNKPNDWRTPRPPEPTVCLWFSNVKVKDRVITAKLGKITIRLPDIKEVKTMIVAKDGTLIRIPLGIAKQFGGRVW